ncbi:MAG: ATP-dependent DNA helicase RecG [Candidatus Sericytochromatia bacterium]|nr:ATP-dependent DNA helicase RecG [Candidatus Sericytochromatia bacterium]
MPDTRLLQRALQIETRHQFSNLRGKSQHFADFVLETLTQWMPQISAHDREALTPITTAFARYDHLEPLLRARAVADLAALLPRWQKDTRDEREDWRDKSVQFIKGVGPRVAEQMARLGLHTVDDLLHHYPRQHLDYQKRVRIQQLVAGSKATIWGEIRRVEAYNPPRASSVSILTVYVSDGSGTVAARWFGRKGNKFQLDRQKARFPVGGTLLLSGEPKIDNFSKKLIFDRPEVELLGACDDEMGQSLHVGRIVPVYDLTEGLQAKVLRKAMRVALDSYLPLVRDSLPAVWRESLAQGPSEKALHLMPLKKALEQIHFPESPKEAAAARIRLAFDELFWMQLGLAWRRAQLQSEAQALQLPPAGELVDRLRALLPFALTHAQERVFREIQADLAAATPMNRLVQGDVGSGKTIVALLTLLVAVENGYQGAMMAPTEILAEQHYNKLREWVEALGLKVALLTGRQGRKERQATLRAIENHAIHIVVGTHALIQEKVNFARLGLVVIDEQHRFGVRQRAMLKEKGTNPEVLVMTATPIPRTLALTLHGDLDVSIIDELPPGRKPVATHWARTNREQRDVWEAVRHEVQQGRQCYVVYPLIDETEKLETVKAATAESERLASEIFPEFKVALLHGQMTPEQKDCIMAAFRSRQADILVSTTVIEVGVDVPNASVMVIENAERFGLSQLHQLRGRVGRGANQSFCFLISSNRSETTAQRLGIMAATNDGFVIAEQDLVLRGPGEFLGTRQSGLPDLKAADLIQDTLLLERARDTARAMVSSDPNLEQYPLLKADLYRYFRANLSFLEVG